MQTAGCGYVFLETNPSTKPQLALAIDTAAFGDIVIVTRMDRLARSAGELLTIYRALHKRGVSVLSLSERITDPSTEAGRWFPYFIEWFAKFDADAFKERMQQGRDEARARAVRWGKPPALSPEQIAKAHVLYEEGGRTLAEIAGRFDVSVSTVSRALAKHRGAKSDHGH